MQPSLVLSELLRPDILEMEPYTPVVPLEVWSAELGFPPERLIKLDANENPYGPSPRARAALASDQPYHIYPDPEQRALRAALAKYVGVDPAHIVVGHGSDELLDMTMRLFLQPGDAIINCPPTFGMYNFDASLYGAQVVEVPRRGDFSVDVEAIENAWAKHKSKRNSKLLFLCSPNNPDGSVTSRAVVERLLNLPLVVVVDEAYLEFAQVPSLVELVPQYPNLIVLRTFSKWAGLAGLRVGYGVFPSELGQHLWKIKQPYNVNVAATVAALASLEDLDYLRANVSRLIAERERLFSALQEIPYLRPYPSQANFILCRVLGRDAAVLKQQLAQRGILVRYFHKPGLTDCIRISIGTPAQTNALLIALRELADAV